MNVESASPKVTTSSHPRRPPAHLSVSLRHDRPSGGNEKPAPDALALAEASTKPDDGSASPRRKQSSDDSEDTSGSNVNEWFDRSNACPAIAVNQDPGETSDPPYFIQQSSNDDTDSSKELPLRSKRHNLHPTNIISRSRDGSTSDEYRSIIDDLTVENQKLKEQLKRYGRSSVAHLEKEKLFEVKVHSLSARKRRDLEELLHAFSTSLDSSEDLGIKAGHPSTSYPLSGKASKHKSVSSGSNSRPTDSAYASMSRYGPSHSSSAEGVRRTAQTRDAADRRMQSFLQDIPQGLLPRTSLEPTENQRKKMVVRRLEQLFTGKTGPLVDIHSHSLQQQEVSNSAARADQVSKSPHQSREGVREAHIGPHNMELDKQGLVSTQKNSKDSKSPTKQSNSSHSNSSLSNSSPEQRPTRPLDLDPDRDQIGSDNVEYIRHLGISAPQLLNEESQDAAVDAEGWVYLNLLINMAQLHIINVTPDFIRSAVTELSKKLQISPDGKKLRWRGGTQGTRLSSDSGGSSVHRRSPLDSDGSDEVSRKRRKVHANKSPSAGPEASKFLNENSKGSVATGPFYYEPMFCRYPQQSYDASCDGSVMSQNNYNHAAFASSDLALNNFVPRDDGPMIFYNGAKFFSDLSGDRSYPEIPLHLTGVDKDGYSSHTQDAIGCSHPRRHLLKSRTSSGSLLPFRPFKDYSKGVDLFQTPETRPQTPSVLSDDMDFEFTTDMACDSSDSPSSLVDLSVCGLGGVQPADHFLYKVHACWTVNSDHSPVKVSRFSAPRSISKKMVHTIPKSSLDSFHNPNPQPQTDGSISNLACLTARANDPLSPLPPRPYENLPVKIENISEEFVRLEPSALPEPTSYYNVFPATEYTGEDSDSSSFSGIAHLRDEPLERDEDLIADNDIHLSSNDDAMDVEDDDDDSIDMLAYARGVDPTAVAAQEENYEREASDKSVQLGSEASKSVIPVGFQGGSESEL